MTDKKKIFISLTGIVIVFAGLIAFFQYRAYFNKNPEGTVGNTAGNLNNGGYYCQVGDTVFFANGYDGGKLYSMKVDETDLEKVSDSIVQYINADEHNVYYYQLEAGKDSAIGIPAHFNGLYYSDYKGESIKCLERTPAAVMKLIDNTIYYQKYDASSTKLTLCKIGIQKKESSEVLNFAADPACNVGNTIYYAGITDDHKLYGLDLETGDVNVMFEGSVWYPDVQGDYVYYMNVADNYRLYRYCFSTGETEKLTEDRVDLFLVKGSYIFYQKNSQTDAALMVMGTDGSSPRVIMEGNYSDINATDSFVYFHEFKSQAPVYHIPLLGGNFQATTFDVAKQEALENSGN